METVYNHNITDEERKFIGVNEKELYLKLVDEETACFDLALLYHCRGDMNKVNEYLKKVSPLMVNDFWRTVNHP